MEADRIFELHEAEAMFEAIANALAVLGAPVSASSQFLHELQAERAYLLRELARERKASL